jgi:DNA-directed RNA polymerase subunit RPC12/RpoP
MNSDISIGNLYRCVVCGHEFVKLYDEEQNYVHCPNCDPKHIRFSCCFLMQNDATISEKLVLDMFDNGFSKIIYF